MKNIYIAGHKGMVGSALVRELKKDNQNNLIMATRQELDLLCQEDVYKFIKNHHIDEIYLAAAKVGGIHANSTFPAEFIYENLAIQNNIIHAAHMNNVNKLLFLGSSCIYPKLSQQPICEDYLLDGKLEETNEPYAIAKIAGIKLCESYSKQYNRDYRSVMPTNLYGIGDNYHPDNSHVIPGLIRRFVEAKQNNDKAVVAWGTGSPRREFLYVDDMARACIHIMNLKKEEDKENYLAGIVNIGCGTDITIKELTYHIAKTVGYEGDVIWDSSKPDGTPRKLLKIDKLKSLGFKNKYDLKSGLRITVDDYIMNQKLYKKCK